MPLTPQARLGPYEVLAPLGAGGMGEVYRARDTRLGREVAIKVLPPAFAADQDRLQRFEREARAAGLLNHPNILTVFDVGHHDGQPYVVSELLEGGTLRDRLQGGAIPPRKAIDYGIAIASGAAAAHDKGIVHRDLKPENVFLTRDGRVKILDFGLAKLVQGGLSPLSVGDAATVATDTQAGLVLGTVGYMSPEQVQGKPADGRSDIFSLGAMLYEMVAGRPPFKRDSAIETMSAILKEDPPAIEDSGVALPPGLGPVVQHCLEKNPEERFQSARDLAFGLQALSGMSGRGVHAALPSRASRRPLRFAALTLLAVFALAGAFLAGRRFAPHVQPSFQQLTFREGGVTSARFGADGESAVFSGAWGAAPEQVFHSRLGSAESRPFELPSARVLAVSRAGDLAVLLNPKFQGSFRDAGMLARLSSAGGAPRELVEGVEAADWAPDGERLAIVRELGGRSRLEFPVGTVLFETDGWVSHPRVAPDGRSVAFIHHPGANDDGGEVMLVDGRRQATSLSKGWLSIRGLAWAGDEVWFSAAPGGVVRQLHAVTRAGKARLLAATTGNVTLHDATPGGRALLTRESERIGIAVRSAGEAEERDLSWLDWSLVRDISRDGRMIVFDETGEGGGPKHGIFMRRLDGSPAVRLGDGQDPSLSADERWVACLQDKDDEIVVLPTGAGEAFRVQTPGLSVRNVAWFPDNRRLLIFGAERGKGTRHYVQRVDEQTRVAVTPEGIREWVLSSDGRFLLARTGDGSYRTFPTGGGPAVQVSGIEPGERLMQTTPDGRGLYVFDRQVSPVRITLVDLATGRRSLAATVAGRRPSIVSALSVQMTPDLQHIAYSYGVSTSDLYLAERLR